MMEAPVTESTATEVSAEAASHKGEFFLIDAGLLSNGGGPGIRSEERRVGEEGRSRGAPYHLKKKKKEKEGNGGVEEKKRVAIGRGAKETRGLGPRECEQHQSADRSDGELRTRPAANRAQEQLTVWAAMLVWLAVW